MGPYIHDDSYERAIVAPFVLLTGKLIVDGLEEREALGDERR